MGSDNKEQATGELTPDQDARLPYEPPTLIRYGRIEPQMLGSPPPPPGAPARPGPPKPPRPGG